MSLIPHDPDAKLPYRFDWAVPDYQGRTWLGDDTIVSAVVTTDAAGIVLTDQAGTAGACDHDDTTVTVWVAGGTANTTAVVTCHIVTSSDAEDERSMTLSVVER